MNIERLSIIEDYNVGYSITLRTSIDENFVAHTHTHNK